ncbi:MAG: aromatic ring-hydroxylating dioxygenase subunit alpha [Actinomycetota bacterium]
MESYPVDPARALPATAYRAASLEVDLERVWRTSWVWVGTAEEVAEPGDHVAVEVAGQPVIVLRRQDGRLAAMSNMCAHRGTLLVEGRGNTKRFQCPYHAWTYADDGRLLAVPHAARDDVDREQHGLPSYRAEEWHGLVFVSLRGDIEPLVELLGHLDGVVSAADAAELHDWTSRRQVETWDANWKLVLSNAMESYHLFQVHEKTLEPLTPTADAYYLTGSAHGSATGGRTRGAPDYVLFCIPPSFVGVLTGDSLLWQAVRPVAHDRSEITVGGAYRHPDPERSRGVGKWLNQAMAAGAEVLVPDFLPEDRAICERGQRASGGDFEPGVIVPMEHIITDFHHFLAHKIHGAELPEVRSAGEVGVAKSVEG